MLFQYSQMADDSTDEASCYAFENLSIHDKQDDALPQPNNQVTKSSRPPEHYSPNLIICDAWYGFPTQKRPRKERIGAVSRQLVNFLQWRLETNIDRKQFEVHLLGNQLDVDAVRDRICEIAKDESSISAKYGDEIIFKPNMDIHEAIQQWRNDNETDEEVVYLSPDASETLLPSSRPPRAVIVGMLIDRRITSDRSRKRAEESLNLRAVKLPIEALHVKEMSSDEPLNVDTVMELMQRWWCNCGKLEQQVRTNTDCISDHKNKYRKCFVEAAAWAMKSHRERHPNRTVHKEVKEEIK